MSAMRGGDGGGQRAAGWRSVLLAAAVAAAAVLAAAVIVPLRWLGDAPGAPAAAGGGTAEWRAHLSRVDDALAGGRVGTAIRAWQDAYAAALLSRRWDSMVEVGDAYLRIGDVVEFRRAFVERARGNYLVALYRARQQGSLDGVLRTAEAFLALADPAGAGESLEIAGQMAGDERTRHRIRTLESVAIETGSRP